MRATTILVLAGASALLACGGSEAREPVRGPGDTARASVALAPDVSATPASPPRFGVGHRPPPALVRAWDIDVAPDGRALPAGSGTYARGAALFAQRCAACHGARGEGLGEGQAAMPRLIGRGPRGGFPFAQDPKYPKTIGNYWPHSTTLFDYVRRAMPLSAPGTLTNDETYSLVAYLLAENEIIGRDAVMDARTLPAVRMPARDRFVPDDRKGGPGFR